MTDDLAKDRAPAPPDLPRAVRGIGRVFAVVAGALTMLLMLLTVVDIGMRQLAGTGLPVTLEVTEVALVAVVFLGMTGAQLSHTHVSTPVLVDRLSPRRRHLARGLGLLVVSLLVAWLVWSTTMTGLASWRSGEFRFGLVQFPVWPAKLIIPIGATGFLLVLVSECVASWAAVVRGRADGGPEARHGD
ncbi:MAG: TRAP transporter small permease subunit [Pseudonocardia sp.]